MLTEAAAILSNPEKVSVDVESAVENLEQEKGETKVDPPKEEAPPKKEEPLSPRLAQLAREEKRLREERNKFQAERDTPEWKEFTNFKTLKSSAKEDPLSVLESLGLTYDEITDYVISGKAKKDPSVRTLETKLEQMERERKEEREKAQKDLENAQLDKFKSDIKQFCLSKNEAYELVNLYGAHNLVYNVIQAHYDKTQEVLSTEKAAEHVEKYLEDQAKSYLGSKKLQGLFGTPAQKPTVEETKPGEQSITLSNSQSQGQTSTEEESSDPRVLLEKAKKLISK